MATAMGTRGNAARPRKDTNVRIGCSRFAVGTPSRGISQRLTAVSTAISMTFAAARKRPNRPASSSASG
jgi:hypothetical protein